MMNKRDCYHFLSSVCRGHTVFTSVMPSISSPRLQSDCKPVSSLFESLLCSLLSIFAAVLRFIRCWTIQIRSDKIICLKVTAAKEGEEGEGEKNIHTLQKFSHSLTSLLRTGLQSRNPSVSRISHNQPDGNSLLFFSGDRKRFTSVSLQSEQNSLQF